VRVFFFLLPLPILILLCALTVYRMPLPAALAGSRDLVAAVAAGLIGMGYLGGLLVYLLFFLRRAGRALDPALAQGSLHPTWTPLGGRHYTGEINGRDVEARYRPAYALQPAHLDVTVHAPLGQRLALSTGSQRPLLDCRDCPRIEVPGLPGIRVYAADEFRAHAWLTQAPVQAALARLLAPADGAGVGELYVQPDQIWLRARLRMAESELAAWAKDALPALSALAEAGESG
jgi:hypothetical protein